MSGAVRAAGAVTGRRGPAMCEVDMPLCSRLYWFLFEQEDGGVKELSVALQLLRNCLYQNGECKVSRAPSPSFASCAGLEPCDV